MASPELAPVVVFQGEPGAYSEKAAFELLGTSINTKGLHSFEECFRAVESGEALFAMLPFENSLGGSIHLNYDLQLRHKLHVVAELDFRVVHCLMALPGVSRAEIKYATSHPQALAQTDRYLRSVGLIPKSEYDTAGAAKLIAQGKLRDTAAVASSLAAKHYGLEILDEGIEDNENNYTRFLLLSRERLQCAPPAACPMKTSVVVSLTNAPGILFKALAAFSLREVDLSKIESRPDNLGLVGRHLPPSMESEIAAQADADASDNDLPELAPPTVGDRFRYMFYMDLTDSVDSKNVRDALRHVQELAPFIRVLGCYPKGGVLLGHVADAINVDSGTVMSHIANPGSALGDANVDSNKSNTGLRIGIVGFGNFGQFIAKTFTRGHTVKASSRTDYTDAAKELGVDYFPTAESMIDSGLDVLVLATSILSFEAVVAKLPKDKVKGLLIVDVLSVKAMPKQVLLEAYGDDVDILCTHPMYGPESGKYSWRHLPFVFERVRVANTSANDARCSTFLDIFRKAGCRMVEMSCEVHDRAAAGSQFVTHFVGRMLARLQLSSTAINTKGFETLLALVDNTCRDSFDLFYALYHHNPNSSEQLSALKDAVAALESELTADITSDASTVASADAGSQDMFRVASRLSRVQPSKTGAAHAHALELKRQGKDVITTLTVGEPDFPPPPQVLDAIASAATDGQHMRYTPMVGSFELRAAIATSMSVRKGVEYDPQSEIIVTPGGKQGVYMACMALCEKGDEVLIPTPYWPSYPEIVRLSGAEPVFVERRREDDFVLTPQALIAAITPRTRMLIFCNPCNPTGATHTPEQLESIASVLRRPEFQHVLVLSDEIYERMVYDGVKHMCFSALPGMRDRTIVLNGFSKGFSMTGLRLAYLCANKFFIGAFLKLQSQLSSCASSLSQHAGVVALGICDEDLQPLYDGLKTKRDFVIGRLQKISGVACNMPNGAFYAFPDFSRFVGATTPQGATLLTSGDLCKHLLEEYGLALTDGDGFGSPGALRMSYATSMEDLDKALERIERCVANLVLPR